MENKQKRRYKIMKRLLLVLVISLSAFACHAQEDVLPVPLIWEASPSEDVDHYNVYRLVTNFDSINNEDFTSGVLTLNKASDIGLMQINPHPVRELKYKTEATTIGLHIYGVTARDLAGNESQMAITSRTITLSDLDRTAPLWPLNLEWLRPKSKNE